MNVEKYEAGYMQERKAAQKLINLLPVEVLREAMGLVEQMLDGRTEWVKAVYNV
jgi:hypothetical protein